MRRLIFGICACLALTAITVRSYFERAISWALAIMPAQAPAFAFASAPVAAMGASASADPMVERHEAGQFRRAAARGI